MLCDRGRENPAGYRLILSRESRSRTYDFSWLTLLPYMADCIYFWPMTRCHSRRSPSTLNQDLYELTRAFASPNRLCIYFHAL